MLTRPVIGLSADLKHIAPHNYHCVGDKYARAIAVAADGVPILLPALTVGVSVDEILALIDGLVLTGSYANVHPSHYGSDEPFAGSPIDPARDAANLRLIPHAIEQAIPVLGICRGIQEINVALGGTLHQNVHEQADFSDHREDSSQNLDIQYAPAHPIYLREGGILSGLSATPEQSVNSLHGQGLDRLAEGLEIEATAGDGLIEAVRVRDAAAFALAVQWHPEWKPHTHPLYAAIWQAFGAACRERACHRRQPSK